MHEPAYRLESIPKPLEGNLYLVPGVADRLGHDFLDGLYGLLRYDPSGSLPILSAVGRNYTVALPNKLGAYDCLQVAGAGNYDLGIRTNDNVKHGIIIHSKGGQRQKIQPPSVDAGLFISHTAYFENGEIVEKENVNPVGSYTSASAKRKIDNTYTAHDKLHEAEPTVLTPLYIGRFEYDIPDQNGDPQTAILMLVPGMGERFDATLLRPLTRLIAAGKAYPGFETDFRNRYRTVLADCFKSIGLSIASAHLNGLNHNQLTAGNAAVFKCPDGSMIPYLTDWDTMTYPATEDTPYARALDLVIAIHSNASIIYELFERCEIGEDSASFAMGMTVLGLLDGYLEKMGMKSEEVLSPNNIAPLVDNRMSNLAVIKYIANLVTLTSGMPDNRVGR